VTDADRDRLTPDERQQAQVANLDRWFALPPAVRAEIRASRQRLAEWRRQGQGTVVAAAPESHLRRTCTELRLMRLHRRRQTVYQEAVGSLPHLFDYRRSRGPCRVVGRAWIEAAQQPASTLTLGAWWR
jgi:hypothetical protein